MVLWPVSPVYIMWHKIAQNRHDEPFGTAHYAASCSNKSRWQITLCVQVRRLVAATCCGDTSQRQIASCVREKFCENLCLCNRILSPRKVAQILSDLIFCNMLLRQNSAAETKIFTKILKYTRSDLSLLCVAATCCCNLSPSVYRPLRWTLLAVKRPRLQMGQIRASSPPTRELTCRFRQVSLWPSILKMETWTFYRRPKYYRLNDKAEPPGRHAACANKKARKVARVRHIMPA